MENLSKIRWKEFVDSYLPVILIWMILGATLALPSYNLFHGCTQILLLFIISYYSHSCIHNAYVYLSQRTFINKYLLDLIFVHVSIHHYKQFNLPRWLDLLIDCIFTIIGTVMIYTIQYLSGVYIFSTTVLIYITLLYNAVHLIDYTYIGSTFHQHHHINEFTNFSFEFMDVLCGSLYNPNAPYNPIRFEIFYGVLAFIIAGSVKLIYNFD
jgi:hypothetical protein